MNNPGQVTTHRRKFKIAALNAKGETVAVYTMHSYSAAHAKRWFGSPAGPAGGGLKIVYEEKP